MKKENAALAPSAGKDGMGRIFKEESTQWKFQRGDGSAFRRAFEGQTTVVVDDELAGVEEAQT